MIRRRFIPFALLPIALLAACSTASDEDSHGENETSESGASESGVLTGTMDDWMAAVCPESSWAEGRENNARGGTDTVGVSYWCDAMPRGAELVNSNQSIELFTYGADPTEYWESQIREGAIDHHVSFAIGQGSDGKWYVIHEDDYRNFIEEPYSPVLEEFGFEVRVNQ